MIGFGRPIFRVFANARGAGDATATDAATTYATGFFAGAMVTWILQALASTFRGLGDAAFPGRWMLMSSLMQMPLGCLLTFGVGGFAGIGIIGIGFAAPAAQCFALIILTRRIRRDVGGLGPLISRSAQLVYCVPTVSFQPARHGCGRLRLVTSQLRFTRLAAACRNGLPSWPKRPPGSVHYIEAAHAGSPMNIRFGGYCGADIDRESGRSQDDCLPLC
jgi:hypothetical protein